MSWLTPECPLNTREKVWVESRMRWLADSFGIDRLLNAQVILPTDEFFPERYDEDLASARVILDRMCRYMGIDPGRVNLEIREDQAIPDAAGLYERQSDQSNICIAQSQLKAPDRLAATIAHELAHELLLGGNILTTETGDHEQITDLLPVFLGTGIFIANATIREETRGVWWFITRQGYLTSFVLGYALALFAFMRRETKSLWARYLRPDAASTFHRGLRYLNKTGDSLFHPDTIREPHTSTPERIVKQLGHKYATFRLKALDQVLSENLTTQEAFSAVQRCLDDRDSIVRVEAASVIALFGETALDAVPKLLGMLQNDFELSLRAGQTLARLRARPDIVIPELIHILKVSPNPDGAAWALREYGPVAERAVPNLLAALEEALIRNNDLTALIAALQAISHDVTQLLRNHFANDPEFLRIVFSELSEKQV